MCIRDRSCTPCNKVKLNIYPKSKEEQTIHPYFDHIENQEWIKANVLHTNPIGFEFFVDPPDEWDKILKIRTRNHFNAFKLDKLYSSHAIEELRGISVYLEKLFQNDPALMVDQLNENYTSRLKLGVNSWQAVFYKALLNDSWFCSGGLLT